jgi:hypothetical protein
MVTVVLMYLIMVKLDLLDSAREFTPMCEKVLQINFDKYPRAHKIHGRKKLLFVTKHGCWMSRAICMHCVAPEVDIS